MFNIASPAFLVNVMKIAGACFSSGKDLNTSQILIFFSNLHTRNLSLELMGP